MIEHANQQLFALMLAQVISWLDAFPKQ